MKAVSALLFLISLATSALAQTSTPTPDCPDVLIQDYAWGVVRRSVSSEDPKFKANSTGRSLNTKDNPINTVGNPVNMEGIPVDTSPVRPQGAPPTAQVQPGGNPETVQDIQIRRETYLLVKNSGNKTIKAINWDYVFFTDSEMRHELKRHKFRSKKKIAPGEAKFLSEYVSVRSISRYQRVLINQVEFADGSIWQRPY
jgi:hypothetical protein